MAHAFAFVRELANYNGEKALPLSFKELFFTIPANRIVPFPHDFVDYIMLSTQIGNIKKPISQSTVLSSFPNVPPVTPAPRILDNLFFNENYTTNGFYAGQWGKELNYGNNRNYGAFSVNYALKRFEFDHKHYDKGKSLIIDYLSDCVERSDELCLAPQWQTPMQHWILWKYHSMRSELGVAQEQERIFNDAMVKARQTLALRPEDFERIVEQVLGYRHT
jgi:hypothetical protein